MSTSPTLVLKIDAPQALGALKLLREEVAALKAGLAGLGNSSSVGVNAGFTRLSAEVKELRAALTASRLENDGLLKAMEARSAATAAVVQKEVAATRELTAAHALALREQVRLQRAADAERVASSRGAAAAQAEASALASGVGRGALRGVATAGGAGFLTYAGSVPAMAAIGTTFAVAATLKDSIKAGADFQQQMAFVQVASEESAGAIAQVSQAVNNLGGDTLFKPTEMAKGMRILTQAGFDTKASLEVLQPVMNLAVVGEQTVGQAAETAAGMMHAFGLTAKDVPHIVDAVGKAANLSQTNVNEMSQALRQGSTIAQQYNVNIDEMSALLSVLATRNIRGSAAGTALTNMFRELDPATTSARRAFKAVGVEITDAFGGMKPILPLLQEFAQKFSQFDQMSQNRLAADYFNNRGAKAFLNAMAEANGQLPLFLKQIQASSEGIGFMQRAVEILGATAAGEFKKLGGALEKVEINAFTKNAKGLTDVIKDLQKLAASEDFQSAITLMVGGFTLLLSVVTKIATAYGWIVTHTPAVLAAKAFLSDKNARGASGSWGDAIPQVNADALMPGDFNWSPVSGPKKGYNRIDADAEAIKKARAAQIREDARDRLAGLQQESRFELAELAAKQKAGLIAEQVYTDRVDEINRQREQNSVDIANEEISKLVEIRNSLAKEQDRIAQDTAIMDARRKRDALVRESYHSNAMVDIRLKGEEKAARDTTRVQLGKLNSSESQRLIEERKKIDVAVMPADVAAAYNAEIETRRRFKDELLAVDQDIAKRPAGDNGPVMRELVARKKAIEDAADTWVSVNRAAAQENLKITRSWAYGTEGFFVQYVDNATNAAEQSRRVWGTAMQGIEESTTQMIMKGKADWRSLLNAVLEVLVRIQVQKAAAGLITQFGPMFGGASGGAPLQGSFPSSGPVMQAHSGGILGFDSFVHRNVPLSLFAGAQRYHSGGLIGPSEVPIIAKHGEGVFTQEQMKNLAPAGAGGTQNIRVEMHNEGTQQQVAKVTPRMDVDGMVISIITRDLAVGGPVSQHLEAAFGMNRKPR